MVFLSDSIGKRPGRAGAGPWPVRRPWWACVLPALLLLLCWLPLLARADDDPLAPWKPFMAQRAHSVATGLQGKVLRYTVAVGEDANGRIWVGDYSGVSRLDGDVQRRFEGADVPEMAEGYTHAFFPLADGDMLVGGDREGLLRFDHRTERFQPIGLASGERLTRINALSPAHGGGVWVASEQGLFHWRPGQPQLQPDPPLGRLQVASQRVFDVQQMPDGTLWLAAQPGLYRRLPGQASWELVRVDEARLQQRLQDESVWQMTVDDQGRLWAGMMQSGVVVIDAHGKAFAPLGLDGHAGLHQGRTIRTLLWEPVQQRMLVGTDGVGMLAVQGKAARALPVNLSEFTGGRNFHVRALLRARDGRIWAASDRGVFHLDPRPGRVIELDGSVPGKDPFENPGTVRSLFVDGAGRLWLGQPGGIVQVLDPASGRRSVIRLPPPLNGDAIFGITADAHGRIWMVGHGVAWVDAGSLQAHPAGEIGRAPGRRYTGVASDGQRIWLSHNEGLVEVDWQGRILRRMETAAQGLRSTRLNSLAWRDGRLWAGTAEGLHEIDLAGWKARLVPVEGLDASQGMYHMTVSALATTSGVWTGTLQGIAHGKGDASSLRLLMPSRSSEIRGLVDDRRGGVWFSMAARPARLGRLTRSGTVEWMPARKGMHPDTVLQVGGMVATAQGGLALATDTGVLMVDPAVVGLPEGSLPDLSPRVLAVGIDGQWLPDLAALQGGRPLQLSHDVERLEMSFSSLDYTGSSLRRYSYRLEGLDSRWNQVTDATPKVFYSRLPAGSYSLLLRTTSDEFPGQEWVTRIPLEVQPVWYENRWSGLLLGLGTGLLLFGLVQLRVARVRRFQNHLQAMVAARTEQLQQANERLARLASEDALTGLDSRRRGLEKLAELHARRRRVGGEDALILIDLDHFKQINDTHGHLAGDAVLREVAGRLRRGLREVDIAMRYGGEELLVVLPDTSLVAAAEVARRLAHAVRSSPVMHDGVAIPVSASFGVAPVVPGETVNEWIARADAVLYRAKEAGRDRIEAAWDAVADRAGGEAARGEGAG